MAWARKRVAVLGSISADEFDGLLSWLNDRDDCEILTDDFADIENVDAVFLCVSRPQQTFGSSLEDFRRKNPLAWIVQIFGPWCVGEARTGPTPEGIVRMAWYQWAYRLPWLLESDANLSPTFAPQEEVFAFLASIETTPKRGTVGIVAKTFDDYDYLRSACESLGFTTNWVTSPLNDPPEKPTALLGIAAGTESADFTPISDVFKRVDGIPKILCLGTPTWEDWDRAKSCGISAILGQPFQLSDVAQLLKPAADCGILPLVNPSANR
ncbi:hypothetical protein ACYFX5_03425 [Bremerella sp. T1]|uniref:hypothetical protein n=1 Tax=Bremerella sp. TYQ1 TaxID=3119568 RepID=UPI001CCE39B3|nr:hypothetical protein [Bremerella volcania]UBM37321.1 hypothetical protein LA756_05380 [Bremerella volcania]